MGVKTLKNYYSIKDEYCLNNKIRLIRISDINDIENTLKEI